MSNEKVPKGVDERLIIFETIKKRGGNWLGPKLSRDCILKYG